ncbi:MAG: hypothetical protein IPH97_05810 [Ignavibacteriales bacterium]|nr:hypothetical protein [Ignavibacteriales bacterium]
MIWEKSSCSDVDFQNTGGGSPIVVTVIETMEWIFKFVPIQTPMVIMLAGQKQMNG